MKKKVLVAEDDKAIREVVTIVLENEGFEVIRAEQSDLVFQSVKKQDPDIILLDIWLYGEDGSKIAKKIKSQAHSKDIPVIIMSANSETKAIAKSCGANDFLLKPFNIDDLVLIVNKHLSN